ILQISNGMLAAHRIDIVHRDLKPANLFLENRGKEQPRFVRILDFGIAKFSPTVQEQTLTQSIGAPLGTPRYAAPEQLNGGKIGPPCDIYAIGTIAYEMLSGTTPFTGEPTELITEKMIGDPVHLSKLRPDLPAKLSDFVMRMIARLPKDRPADLQEVIEF